MRLCYLGLMFAPLAIGSSPAFASSISLICFGGGSANKMQSSTVDIWGTGGSATAQAYSNERVGFDDQVNVEINEDNTGRIRVPRTMLPILRGGKDGWFEFRNIKRTDHEITGSAAINVINSPKVRLDRLTGTINISGKAGEYVGQCEPYDPTSIKPKF